MDTGFYISTGEVEETPEEIAKRQSSGSFASSLVPVCDDVEDCERQRNVIIELIDKLVRRGREITIAADAKSQFHN